MLFRRLTLRSIIGFGLYPELTVQELIQLRKHKELLKMYYGLEKIDFDAEVKEHLKITPEREVPKPGKSWEVYHQHIYKMTCEINEATRIPARSDGSVSRILEDRSEKKHKKVKLAIIEKRMNSKIYNRAKNQKKK